MNLNFVSSSSLEEIKDIEFDIFICSSGYENRASYFSSIFDAYFTKDIFKICFAFEDKNIFSSRNNINYFKSQGFEFVTEEYDTILQVISALEKIIYRYNKPSLRVVVDYSCMTKIMYAGILKFFQQSKNFFTDVNIYLTYTPSLYVDPLDVRATLYSYPLELFPVLETTNKKIALIINLGYEHGKAQALIDFWEISTNDVYLFYTTKKPEDKFHDKILENNNYLLTKTPIKNQFTYDFENTTQILTIMESLSNYLLSNNFRIIIAPIGTKHFALLAILLSFKYNNVTVLRVSYGEKVEPQDKFPDVSLGINIIRAQFLR